MASPTSTVVGPIEELEHLTLLQQDESLLSTPSWECVPASKKSLRTINPIRAILDVIVADLKHAGARTDGKQHISLALGDPTSNGNLPACQPLVDAITRAVVEGNAAAGYAPACGTDEARQAIAQFHSVDTLSSRNPMKHSPSSIPPPVVVDPSSVIVANGCSGALELALTALLDEDSILLVPQPGFPLYQVIAESHGAAVVHYRLKPENNWECDLDHLQEIMQQYCHLDDNNNLKPQHRRIRGIVLNNPSNPTGAVFSKSHLYDLFRFCQQHKLPVIADEIYGDLTYGNHHFYPAAAIANELGRHVPVITASGLGKQYLVPGWRVGWIVFHDNIHGSLRQVEAGAKRLAQVILGASHLAQIAVPAALSPSTDQWKSEVRQTLEQQAAFLCEHLSRAAGLEVMPCSGAMYAMVRIDVQHFPDFPSELEFTKSLLEEENVFVLPGSCFGIRNAFRVVFCAPASILEQAATRIVEFCARHYMSATAGNATMM